VPASLKELDRRIRSVKNTQQITRAMKMVAAAKLRRAQDRLVAARPYGAKLEELLDGLSGTKIDHPLFEQRDLKRRFVVVVSSDKGLCGSYNANILREAEDWLKANDEDGVENVVYAVGRKANDFFKRRQWKIETAIDDLGGVIDVSRFNHIADDLMHRFLEDEVQEIRVFYTRFVSTLRYEPTEAVMLPLQPAQEEGGAKKSGEFLYEPSAEAVLAALLPKSVRNRVFNAIAEAATSEHGARMTSMGAATDNAGKMIDSLTLFRNRARQAAITQEISEIVGGANALA
jgi:F-type H+-transporting ATPase subunit gamma